jgi:hypothetical protein
VLLINHLKTTIMTQEEIIDYNKRCAEFLGSELKNDGQYNYWTYDDLGFDPIKIRGSAWVSGNFEFHSNWNWIKLVLEKISSLNEDNFSLETQQSFEDLLDLSLFSTQESVCESINNFLKTLL